jgi:hypothetical protein
MFAELQIPDDFGLQQADCVGGGRVSKAGIEFLRDTGAANHPSSFQYTHPQPSHAKIGRAGQPIVTCSDYNGVEIRHGTLNGRCTVG